MNTVTHALLPLVVAGLCERSWRLPNERKGYFSRGDLIAIAIAGAAPDLLNPHLSLAARLSSYSHTIWAVLVFGIMVLVFLKRRKHLTWRLYALLVGAYGVHLLCDLVAGGIAPFYPFMRYTVYGDYWVSPIWWVPTDAVLVLGCYFLFRAIPQLRKTTKLYAEN